jgi:hypothetical protein
METIGDLLSRDLTQRIEEVIQVHQADEQSVYAEVSEYVATNSIRDQYATLMKAIAEAPAEPHESIGVWVSGFFGSGKSSFAKNLGYALKNPSVRGEDLPGSSSGNWTTSGLRTYWTSSTPRSRPRSFSSRSPRRRTPAGSRSGSPS